MQKEKVLQVEAKYKHYIVYIISNFGYGILILSLGPLIPFLAAKNDLNETQYSFLFSCRAAGMMVGSLLMAYLQSKSYKPTIHQFFIISSLAIIVSSLMFIWANSQFQQGFWIFTGSIAYFILQISVNISMIILSDKNRVEFWLMFINGIFGLGGFFAPILVYLFQINSYYVIVGVIGITIPAYILLPTPQTMKRQVRQSEAETQTIDKRTEYILSFIIFIYVGAVATIEAWSSSYSVITGISSKEEATVYPAIFLLIITACRFIIPFFTIKTSEKLKISIIGVVAFQLITLTIVNFGYVKQALIFNSITMGIFMSSVYALIFSISSQFDKPLTEKQASSIASWGVIGDGALSPVCAKLMQFISPHMFFYFILILYAMMWVARSSIMDYFNKKPIKNFDINNPEIQMSLMKNGQFIA